MTAWRRICVVGIGVALTGCAGRSEVASPPAVAPPPIAERDLGGGCSFEAPHAVTHQSSVADKARDARFSRASNAFGFPLEAASEQRFAAPARGRVLVVWTEGSLEWGKDIHAVAVDDSGSPIGPTVTVSSGRGNVVGQPGTHLGPGLQGSISFRESTEDGIRQFETTVRCSR